MLPDWLLHTDLSAPDTSPDVETSAAPNTDPAHDTQHPDALGYPSLKLASFGHTLTQWIKDLDERAAPILNRLLDDPAADYLLGGLQTLLKTNREFLSRCDELLRSNFELDQSQRNPNAILTAAQYVSGEILVSNRGVLREGGRLDEGDTEVDALRDSIIVLAEDAFEGTFKLLNEQTTNQILSPDLQVKFDPTRPLEKAEHVIARFAAQREHLLNSNDLNSAQQLLLIRGSAQGTQLFRFIEVTSDTTRFDGSVLSAQEEYLETILGAKRIFDESKARVAKEMPDKCRQEMVAHFDAISEELAIWLEGLKSDLRQAWQRVWNKQTDEQTKGL